MTQPELELVSFDLCPYVQRSAIVLHEKGLPFRTTYIDLADKPEWFLKISPTGKVPLLRVGNESLFESCVINEFIDEQFVDPPLMPKEPLPRALARMWIEFLSGLGAPTYRLMVEPDESLGRAAAQSARTILQKVEGEPQGPYWLGETFSLVDAAAAPFLQRLHWVQELAPELELFESAPRVFAWTKALLQRKSVQSAVRSDIKDRFYAYLHGRGAPSRQAPASFLASRTPSGDSASTN